jgi:hypothetical protein
LPSVSASSKGTAFQPNSHTGGVAAMVSPVKYRIRFG